MKISILLPYKENYSPVYAGAVSLFVYSMSKISKYKSSTTVFGSTDYKTYLSKNYVNLKINKSIFSSSTKNYISNFLTTQDHKVELIEVHNRPNYIMQLKNLKKKLVLYFHNDPNTMLGSKTLKEKVLLLETCTKIIFNSNWAKNQFLMDLPIPYRNSQKLIIIYQSINKKNVNINKKKRLISFVGKLNSAKGYDIFGSAIIKILNKYPSWKANVIGDEPREKFNFYHRNLNILGFKKHSDVLLNFEMTDIAVVCSRWNEPFGRTSLEASSRGCAVIISNRGGLPETTSNGIILKKLDAKNLFLELEKLIIDKKRLVTIQKKTLSNFYLTDHYICEKIDQYRHLIKKNNTFINKPINKKKLKILHITNFNERHNGRLFYNTGRRINNGFIRLNHNVLELSDRDIVSYSRGIGDPKGFLKLNKKFLEIVSNYVPDLIVFGHADLITNQSIEFIKKNYPNIKICQWFLDRMDSEWKINKLRFKKKDAFNGCKFLHHRTHFFKF
jgi:glycosyltransferase involved in cell wall biosynthesis